MEQFISLTSEEVESRVLRHNFYIMPITTLATYSRRKEGESSYDIPWFAIVQNIPPDYSETIFTTVKRFLENWDSISVFDSDRNITEKAHTAILLIEYSDRAILESDRINNSQIKLKNPIQSEPIDEVRQLWESIWDFEWNGKHYLVVYTYNSLTSETSPERGIFQWVIVDRNKYIETRPRANWVQESAKNATDNIMKDNL